jgi:hypothetical protein
MAIFHSETVLTKTEIPTLSSQVLGGSAASMSMPESAALGGMRNDHSSTLKKAGLPHKAMAAGSGAARGGHIRRASGSGSLAVQPPPSKVRIQVLPDPSYAAKVQIPAVQGPVSLKRLGGKIAVTYSSS